MRVRVTPNNTLLFNAEGKEGELVEELESDIVLEFPYVVKLDDHPWLLTLSRVEFEVIDS